MSQRVGEQLGRREHVTRRNPVPIIVTGVGRAVEPMDGEIAVTLGALGAAGGNGVGLDGTSHRRR